MINGISRKINWWVEYRTIWLLVMVFGTSILSKLFVIPHLGAAWFSFSDEHHYIELAKSIYYHHNFFSNVFPNIKQFSEILFPLLLSPLYALYSPENILTVLRFFCLLVMSCAVFPAYALGLAVLNNKKYALLISFFAVLIPEMTLAFSVIQEVIYYPLFLFTVYLIYQKISGKGINPVFLSFILFLLWTCKAIGATVFAGYILYLFFEFIFINKFRNYKSFVYQILIIVILVLGLRELLSLAIRYINFGSFTAVGDFWTHSALSRLAAGAINFLSDIPNGILYYLFFTLCIFMIFPLILPFDNFDQYELNDRKFLLFLAICFVITIFAVVVLIYIDDGGSAREVQRVHYRYFFQFFTPLLIMTVKLDFSKIKFKYFGIFCSSFIVLYYLLFQPKFMNGSIIDAKSLLLTETISHRIINGSNILALFAAILLVYLGYVLYKKTDGIISKKILLWTIFLLLLINHGYAIYKTYRHYTITTNSITRQIEYTYLSKLVDEVPGTPIVLSPAGLWWVDSLYTTQSIKDFVQIEFAENVLNYPYNPAINPHFIITPKNLFIRSKIQGAEYVDTGLKLFDVYKINDISTGKIKFDYIVQNIYPDNWLMDDAKLLISGEGEEIRSRYLWI